MIEVSLGREGSSNPTRFEMEDRETRALLRGLHKPSPVRYWTDLLVTAALGWAAFGLAITLDPFSTGMLIAVGVAILALYRGLCFIHEISHLNPRAVPGFERAWNWLVGYPLLLPSFTYVGVHQAHHSLSTYGTEQDPEYLPFSKASHMPVMFALQALLIPVILFVRFFLIAPLSIMFPGIQRWVAVHASSLAMQPKFRREVDGKVLQLIQRQSAWVLLVWTALIALAATRILPWHTFAIWVVVSALASFINTIRTLGAHDYESEGDPLNRMEQLQDSIDTPGGFWTELWAPVGLRYHALHHYFPGIPYHNLPEAYRRLMKSLPQDSVYHETISPSLPHSLWSLYRRGSRSE